MSVSVDDDLCIRECGEQTLRSRASELVTVGHHDVESIELKSGNERKTALELTAVRVTVDGRDRSQSLKFGQDTWMTNISSMEDVVHPVKGLENFRPEQAMGVRNDAEPHRCRALAPKR